MEEGKIKILVSYATNFEFIFNGDYYACRILGWYSFLNGYRAIALLSVTDQKSKSVSVNDFLSGGKSREPLESRTEFDALPKETKLALQEAMYYAVETGRPTMAVDIKESGEIALAIMKN